MLKPIDETSKTMMVKKLLGLSVFSHGRAEVPYLLIQWWRSRLLLVLR